MGSHFFGLGGWEVSSRPGLFGTWRFRVWTRGEGDLAVTDSSLGGARPERSCSGCDLCCTVLRVDELKKLGGERCSHLRGTPADGEIWGCGIHSSRPSICRKYRCLWLRGGLGEGDRPDQLGAVLDIVPAGAEPYLAIRELRDGTFDGSSRLREIAEEFRASMPVRITSADEVLNPDRPYRVLQPAGREQRVTGEWVTTYADGVELSRKRMPWLERAVRRLQLAVLAFRLGVSRRGRRPERP